MYFFGKGAINFSRQCVIKNKEFLLILIVRSLFFVCYLIILKEIQK